MKQKLAALHKWIYHTGAIVIYPVLVYAILSALQTTALTVTCGFVGMGCPYAMSGDKLVTMYAGAMMSLSETQEYVPGKQAKR